MRNILSWAGWVLAVVAAAVSTLILYLLILYFNNNFHAVIEGELYRSAQVTPEQIVAYKAEHGIASILNLRGPAVGAPWYDAELAASTAEGITHADFRMLAREQLDPARAAELIALMRSLPKPLLIHCQQGADRSGLASALYLAAIAGRSEAEAAAQISIRFGHFSVPKLSQAYPMDESWQLLAPNLNFATP